MDNELLTIQLNIAQGDQKATAEPNQNPCKKLKKFVDTDAHSKKITLTRNELAIKNAEAGSAEQEKDVLIYHFILIPPYPKDKRR